MIKIMIIAFLLLSACFLFFRNIITSDFATDISIRVHDEESNILAISITDNDDIIALKSMFRGRTFSDSPSCGFLRDVSIVMEVENKSILFSPALDGCNTGFGFS